MALALNKSRKPTLQDSASLPPAPRRQETKAFPSNRAQQPFRKRSRLRRPERSPQDDDAQRLQGAIQFRRVDAVPVAENEPVGLLTRDDLSKLLDRPSWRMVGHVEVSNLACSTSMITNT